MTTTTTSDSAWVIPTTQRVTRGVVLSKTLDQRLRQTAKSQGRSLSNLIRLALQLHLDRIDEAEETQAWLDSGGDLTPVGMKSDRPKPTKPRRTGGRPRNEE